MPKSSTAVLGEPPSTAHPEPDPTAVEFSFRNVTRTFPADGGMEFIAVRDINLDIRAVRSCASSGRAAAARPRC